MPRFPIRGIAAATALLLAGCAAKRTAVSAPAPAFLRLAADSETRARLRAGAVLASPARSIGIGPPEVRPDAQVQQWVGAAFVPRMTLARALPVLEDYGNRTKFMAPEIAESRLLARYGDEFLVHLRLTEQSVVPGVFDVRLRIVYRRLDSRRLVIESRSEQVDDVTGGHSRDRGLLWALNHEWRIAEMDDGLYLECEAMVLSRRPPSAVEWLANPLISQAARKTLVNTLLSTRRMIEGSIPVGNFQYLPVNTLLSTRRMIESATTDGI